MTGSTLTGTYVSGEHICHEEFSLSDFHPKQTLPKLKAFAFHAEHCCNMIVRCNVLWAFGTQLDFEDGCFVCDRVSVPMREFPKDASEAALIEHLSQDVFSLQQRE